MVKINVTFQWSTFPWCNFLKSSFILSSSCKTLLLWCLLQWGPYMRLQFAARSNIWRAARGLQKMLFMFSSLENACVCGFTDKHLQPLGWSSTNFTAAVNCRNPKNEIQSEIKSLKFKSSWSWNIIFVLF